MPGVGPEDFFWGGTKNVLTTWGGGYQNYQRKVGGAPKIMYNNHKTSAIIIHCNINVNAVITREGVQLMINTTSDI
jgi:hypothetical protein